ncbi:hypothetical protein GCM10025868_36010 [Angustibacter aerolatus]|uniref:Glutamate--cysteine ligase n=1 Tax=Angustibacter aerolatus TaxID=1162965 RepID=A0ABQ6JLB2_9ACTN|nr:hypothetical protein GCM10025868_36010 [Angustibacter aerolatus]
MPSLAEVAGLTALVQCLVVDLGRRLDAGETLPTLPPWHVQENKWRAARYGLDAEIILDAKGAERLVTDDLADLLTRLEPLARELGCADEPGLARTALAPRREPTSGSARCARRPAATCAPSSTRWWPSLRDLP